MGNVQLVINNKGKEKTRIKFKGKARVKKKQG